MEVEEIINRVKKNNEQIQELLQDNINLNRELSNRPDDEWDWCSVKVACEKLDVTQAMIYQRIHRGQLATRRIGNKILVSLKDIKVIDDSVVNQ